MVSVISIILFNCFCLIHLTIAGSRIQIPSLNFNIKNGSRIVGGKEALDIDIPWMVSLVYFGSHLCGGSIISARTIVTAAHCLEIVNKRYLKVRVGTKDRYNGGSLLPIQDIRIHEDFQAASFHNDVGLIYLTKSLNFKSGAIEPIALPEPDSFVKDGTMAMVSGWGLLKHNSMAIPKMLHYVRVPVINREKCNKLMHNLITDKQFCAGFYEGGKDACQQDSGGPLECNKKLIGIVSWGDECGKAGRPGVYTDVSTVRTWIDKHIKT